MNLYCKKIEAFKKNNLPTEMKNQSIISDCCKIVNKVELMNLVDSEKSGGRIL